MTTVFVDSNIVVYVLDRGSPEKRKTSQQWLNRLGRSNMLTMSVQVLNESYATLTLRKKAPPLEARAGLRPLMRWMTTPISLRTVQEGWSIQDRYGVRIWDALLLGAANAADCTHFLSEDLNDGQTYGAVQVVNPFRHAPEDVLGPALSR